MEKNNKYTVGSVWFNSERSVYIVVENTRSLDAQVNLFELVTNKLTGPYYINYPDLEKMNLVKINV